MDVRRASGRSTCYEPGRDANEAGYRAGRRTERAADQPAEPGKECSIRGSQRRARHLPSQDGNLMAKHNDFDGQIRFVGPLKVEDLDVEGGHGRGQEAPPVRAIGQVAAVDVTGMALPSSVAIVSERRCARRTRPRTMIRNTTWCTGHRAHQ